MVQAAPMGDLGRHWGRLLVGEAMISHHLVYLYPVLQTGGAAPMASAAELSTDIQKIQNVFLCQSD